MNALCVKNLTKRYPTFTLESVSFSVDEGRVCGLVGANGAGKSTTLKGITGLIQTEGEAEIFSLPANSREAKSLVGYAGGGFRFYPQKKVKTLGVVVSAFYPHWDNAVFFQKLRDFGIDPEKKISALSEGMKVKLSLALALSHGARLLILDEPTSGLDPLSREGLCDAIYTLVKKEGLSVLFSTHITSDLTHLADDVVFLSNGKVLLNEPLQTLLGKYSLAVFPSRAGAQGIGMKEGKEGVTALVPRGFTAEGVRVSEPTIDDIIVHFEYERRGM
ncbi:MAG: ABC transporter ATP-binding protein [Clostridia bacterium]|nr:ABC transporter ATP-binding protein [Clostridia bacterium]